MPIRYMLPLKSKKPSGGRSMKFLKMCFLALFFVTMSFSNVFADENTVKQELMNAVDYGVKLIESKGKAAFPELEAFRFNNGRDSLLSG